MDAITRSVGARIRARRLRNGLTQEQLAERADMHNTYIGQVERGEKNLTLVSLEKILTALGISFPEFFSSMEIRDGDLSYATRCYDLVDGKELPDQERMYRILWEIDQLMERSRRGTR